MMLWTRAKVLLLLLAVMLPAIGGIARADDEERTVYVPRNVIYPGDVISADALVASKIIRTTGSPDVFGENAEDLVGKVARRTLMPGALVPNSAVHMQALVVQGHPYKLRYNSEYVSIVGTGIPLQSGSIGEMISVRNPDSGLVIKARVEANQTLTVDGP
jgi:flagellar basal body P-ring formation protein FlgA